MAVQIQFQGSIQISDVASGLIQGNKTIQSLLSSATLATVADTLSVGTGSTSISLPISPTQVVYLQNLHASQNITVTWTPNGGSSATVGTLQPGGCLMLVETDLTQGITALSVQASGASTPLLYILGG